MVVALEVLDVLDGGFIEVITDILRYVNIGKTINMIAITSNKTVNHFLPSRRMSVAVNGIEPTANITASAATMKFKSILSPTKNVSTRLSTVPSLYAISSVLVTLIAS